METILIVLLLLSVLYLIFAQNHTNSDICDIENKMETIRKRFDEYELRIKKLEEALEREGISQRRKNTNSYRRIFETTISKVVIYCNDGWSVSKTLLSATKGKAYRIFERGIRPTYLRAKQNLQGIVYRAKEGQEVLSLQRTKDIHSERIR